MTVPARSANETPLERAERQARAIAMIVAQLPTLTTRTEALLDALPVSTTWDIRFRVRCILQELDMLKTEVESTLDRAPRLSRSS